MNVLQRSLIASIGIAALLAPVAGAVEADATADHLQCFDVKDDLKLRAIADLDSRQLGLDPNCTIGKAKLFCIPATKTVLDIPTLAHMTGPDAGDRICYEAQCKTPSTALPASTLEADQFGARSLTMTRTTLLCTPAVKVLPGFLGRTEIMTPIPEYEGDQFWTDSDGVDPAVAGCHFPFSDGKCTASLARGVFGEFCNPPEGSDGHQAGFPEGALIESNPAADVCHQHKNGLGHPDVYDCDAYCKGTHTQQYTGVCVPDVCNTDATIPSARCACTAP